MAQIIDETNIEPLKPQTKISPEIIVDGLTTSDGNELSPTRSNASTLHDPESPSERPQQCEDGGLVTAPTPEKRIRWVPLRVPLKRRLQTAMVLWFELAPGIFLSIFWFLCAFPLAWPILIPYLLYLAFVTPPHDKAPSMWFSGFIRSPKFWSNYTSYFPMHLHRCAELSPENNYLFGYHPHGIISHGAFGNFVAKTTGWYDLFPGLSNTVLTLESNFRVPFYREYLLAMGVGSVSRASCEGLLGGVEGEVAQKDIDATIRTKAPTFFAKWRGKKVASNPRAGIDTPKPKGPKKGGRCITIVVGGAQESLLAIPGNMQLVLKKRRGFIRVAVRTGAHLVPVLSYGETDLYDQIIPEKSSMIYKFQLLVKKTMGFTIPLFHARGVFNYDVGFVPYRRPINTVVGRPIAVVQSPNPSDEYVAELHEKYCQELQRLWDDYKDEFATMRDGELEFL